MIGANLRSLIYVCPLNHNGVSTLIRGWVVSADSEAAVEPNALLPMKKSPILLLHDLGGAQDDVAPLALRLAQTGWPSYTYALAGGEDARRRRPLNERGLSGLSLDFLQVLAWIRHQEDGKSPLVISSGKTALATLLALKAARFFASGFVFLDPFFLHVEKVSPWTLFCSKMIAEMMPHTAASHFFPLLRFPRHELFWNTLKGLPAHLVSEILHSLRFVRRVLARNQKPILILVSDAFISPQRQTLVTKNLHKTPFQDFISLENFSGDLIPPLSQWITREGLV